MKASPLIFMSAICFLLSTNTSAKWCGSGKHDLQANKENKEELKKLCDKACKSLACKLSTKKILVKRQFTGITSSGKPITIKEKGGSMNYNELMCDCVEVNEINKDKK